MDYILGNGSSIGLAQKYGCSNDRVLEWVARYQSQGEAAFEEAYKKQSYSPDFKKMVLEECLSGGISLRSLALKHKIPDKKQIRNWIKLYNGHKKLKAYRACGGIKMNTGRKTTYEERIEIIEDYLRNGQDYNATAEKYQVSYQQIYGWVSKYNARGVAALKDNRGRGKALEDMDQLECLVAENKLLKAKLERMEIEIELKKNFKKCKRVWHPLQERRSRICCYSGDF